MPSVEDSLELFMRNTMSDGIFLMGTKNFVQDLGVITNNDDVLSDKIIHTIKTKLALTEIWTLRSRKFGGRFFDPSKGQSRKFFMPVVQEAINVAIVE